MVDFGEGAAQALCSMSHYWSWKFNASVKRKAPSEVHMPCCWKCYYDPASWLCACMCVLVNVPWHHLSLKAVYLSVYTLHLSFMWLFVFFMWYLISPSIYPFFYLSFSSITVLFSLKCVRIYTYIFFLNTPMFQPCSFVLERHCKSCWGDSLLLPVLKKTF